MVADYVYRPEPGLYQGRGGYWTQQDHAFVAYPFVDISLEGNVYQYALDVDPTVAQPVKAAVGNVLKVTSAGHLLTDRSGISDVDLQGEVPRVESLPSSATPGPDAGPFQSFLTADHAAYVYRAPDPSTVWKVSDRCDGLSISQTSRSSDVVVACDDQKAGSSAIALFALMTR